MKLYVIGLLMLQFQGDLQNVVFATSTIEDLIRLKAKLFTDYDKDIRPAYNLSDTVTVNTLLFLLSILDIDEVSGTIVLSAGLVQIWHDYRLEWNESEYGGINNITLNATKVWKPKVYLLSSAEDLEQFGSDDFDVRSFSNGYSTVSPGKLVKATCTVDMTNFPTDSQTCSLLLLPWGYNPEEIALSFSKEEFFMNYFSPNGEWNVLKTSVANYTGFGPDSNILSFTLYMSRKSGYFIVSMTIPIYILCFLNPFVFLLPASSGERISYTITMFLSLAVYMTLIGDNMPKVSEPMAGISYFLLVSMLFSCLLIILTIFSLRCHDIQNINKFPKWLVRLVKKLSCKRKEKWTNKLESIHTVSGNHVLEMKDQMEKSSFTSMDINTVEITTFIDKYLFVFTLLIILTVICSFTLRFHKMT